MLSMTLQTPGGGHLKRQNNYLMGSGQATDSCEGAVVYSLVNGQLFANSSSGSQQFSTDPGIQYANFAPSSAPGSLTNTFSVDGQNNLLWSNANFYNNQARWCIMPDDSLIAVFDDPAVAPSNCNFVFLSLTRVSTCAAAVGAPALSGPSGPSGPTGMSGMSGMSGIVGATGPQGIQGNQGIQGIQGIPGETGATGPEGPSGATGATGIQGPEGLSGLPGITGAPGPSGPSGAQGEQGLSGLPGATGIAGPSGPSGPPGPTGVIGAQGIQGIQGVSGQVGETGPTGAQGIQGIQGIQGVVGNTGPSGPSGPRGPGATYAYLGCQVQGCTPTGCPALAQYAFDSSVTNGGFNATLTGTASSPAAAQCANLCITKVGTNFFGLVNSAGSTTTGTVDCYCGTQLTSSSTMFSNCVACNGPGSPGMCGRPGTGLAAYGRAF